MRFCSVSMNKGETSYTITLILLNTRRLWEYALQLAAGISPCSSCQRTNVEYYHFSFKCQAHITKQDSSTNQSSSNPQKAFDRCSWPYKADQDSRASHPIVFQTYQLDHRLIPLPTKCCPSPTEPPKSQRSGVSRRGVSSPLHSEVSHASIRYMGRGEEGNC
jgi:hypothetical protein